VFEYHPDQAKNILKQDPSGPCSFDDSKHLRPEVAVVLRASPLPGDAERLTGWSAGKKESWLKFVTSQLANIAVSPGSREVAGQPAPAPGVNLNLVDNPEAGAFQSVIHRAAAREQAAGGQVQSAQRHSCPHRVTQINHATPPHIAIRTSSSKGLSRARSDIRVLVPWTHLGLRPPSPVANSDRRGGSAYAGTIPPWR
jgi:hypothetical protein